MKVWYASDLHVESKTNRTATLALRDLAIKEAPDVLILGGDVCNGPHALSGVLAMFSGIAPLNVFVPGNHELWDGAIDARTIHYKVLPEICSAHGFDMLIDEPLQIGSIGIVASMGWYDGTFAPPNVFSADALARKQHLGRVLLDASQLRWLAADGSPMSDADVTNLLLDDLRSQIENLGDEVTRVVAALHMVPHANALGQRWNEEERSYFRAFQGSERFGELLGRDSRIRDILCGHDHESSQSKIGTITVHKRPVGHIKPGSVFEPTAHRVLLDL